jgi:hypothetical protein
LATSWNGPPDSFDAYHVKVTVPDRSDPEQAENATRLNAKNVAAIHRELCLPGLEAGALPIVSDLR